MLKQIALAVVLVSVSCLPAQNITMINVPATLEKAVDAKKAKVGDPVLAKMSSGVTLNDGTNVPAGSILEGHIDSVSPSANKGDSTMVLTFDKIQVKNGKEIAVKATLNAVSAESDVPASTQTQTTSGDVSQPGAMSSGAAREGGANRSLDQPANARSGQQGGGPIPGLTVTAASIKDANSATLTQAKKNVHLSSGDVLQLSLAVIPPGATIQ
jgi:hypothetical protein